MLDFRQQLVARHIDAGLFVRHINGAHLEATGERTLTTRGFNSTAERDAFIARHPEREAQIVRPGDAEDPRA